MLIHLSINNYALIEKLEVDFNSGFTVITGETGAGKSILLGALSLILGQRVDTSILNDKEKKCVIEGIFKISKENYSDFFKENDLDFETETTIRREISSSGKSRAFINDTPVNLNVIKDLSEQLINIHSQHHNLLVKSGDYQLAVVDSFANIQQDSDKFKKRFKEYSLKKKQLEELKNKEQKSKSDLELLIAQAKEIEMLKLTVDEQFSIEEQLDRLNNSEEIKQVLHQASNLLSDREENMVLNVKQIISSFSKISHLSKEFQDIFERLNTMTIELVDLSREISILNDNTNFDKDNAEYLTNRLNSIYSLEKKYQLTNSNELLDLLVKINNDLSQLDAFDETIVVLQNEVLQLEQQLIKDSKQLSEIRKKIIPVLAKNIMNNLSELGMPNAKVEISQKITTFFGVNGIDDIEFLFSANKGYAPIEIHKVASGGELSRLMLTIKSILAKGKNLSTIIFDEIDTGVSGDIADKMGNIMKQMAGDIQIVSITHLPQVAAKSNQHYKIFKGLKNGKTITDIEVLNNEQKIEEIAKMLSGKELTKAAIENAKNLISN